ncbi:MAG: hypothetical protein Q9169_003003 [Polycauliona sp. 2 TL-2023]
MIICDDFWKQQGSRPFPVLTDCPKVKFGKFRPDDYRVMNNQFGTFVHEFSHIYTGNFPPSDQDTYHPTAAVMLSAEESIKNAQNFALYASSVVAGCTKHVNPKRLRDHEEIKLENDEGDFAAAGAIAQTIVDEGAAEATEEDDLSAPENPPLTLTFETNDSAALNAIKLTESIEQSTPPGVKRRKDDQGQRFWR